MSEVKLTQLDAKEIPRYTYDEANKAQRVILINEFQGYQNNTYLQQLGISEQLAPVEKIIETRVETVQVPVIITETKIERIEVPIYITEYEQVEVEKVVFIPQIKEIEKVITVTEIKTVEIPVIFEKKEIVYIDKLNYKMFYIMQGITLALIILSKYIKL